MQYTVLGKTGCKVSRLGFGTVHLPMRTSTEVDRDRAIAMLHRAVELGINLFDTAEGYCGQDSQRVLGEAFEGMRDQVVLSTKNFYYERGDKAGWWRRLENSLERLRTDHVDLYYHHALNCALYEQGVAGEGGFYEDMLKAKEQGMIRHICFSSHGPKEDVMKLVDTGLFETVTLQYNLLDRNMEETIAHATESGMGVLLMGPVGGGRLVWPSKLATDLIGEAATTPELALRFVLSNETVHVALSGMATVEELEQNVATVSAAENFSPAEFDRISSAITLKRMCISGYYKVSSLCRVPYRPARISPVRSCRVVGRAVATRGRASINKWGLVSHYGVLARNTAANAAALTISILSAKARPKTGWSKSTPCFLSLIETISPSKATRNGWR